MAHSAPPGENYAIEVPASNHVFTSLVPTEVPVAQNPPPNLVPKERLRTVALPDVATQIINMGFGEWKCNLCDKKHRRKQRAIVHVLNKHSNTRLPCGGVCGKPKWSVYF